METLHDEIVLQLEDGKDVFSLPIKRSERIKYTCFTVSKNYVVFGATSGGLYVFKRNPNSFWQLVPSKESAIRLVLISQSENFVAFASSKNVVCILEFNEQANCKLVTRADDLSDSELTTLCWNDDISKPTLYIGDKCGRVFFMKLSFLNKNILQLPTSVFMTLDSKIVQLCWQHEYLLASTLTRCYLCDTIKETFKQIGQQLRNGYYGATFLTNGLNLQIFCARPGSRLWEVDLNAVVHSTHQFKCLLAVPPSPFVSIFNGANIVETDSNQDWFPQSFNFSKLLNLSGKYVVTYKKDGLYILNIHAANVFFWTNCLGEIIDVHCISNSIYVWNSNGDLFELVVLPIRKCLLTLYLKQHFSLCLELICRFYDKLMKDDYLAELTPLCLLHYSHIPEEKSQIMNKFKEAIKSKASENIELNSGIHVVNNKYFSSLLLDDSNLIVSRKPRSLERSDSEEIRKRSHSLPTNLETVGPMNDNMIIVESTFQFDKSRFYDHLYLEPGLYSSSFLTQASYDLLEDCIMGLSSNFNEKFSESSKNLREKWNAVENKFKRLSTKKSERSNETDLRLCDNGVDLNFDEDIEPVVNVKRKPQVDVNYSRIMEACDCEHPNLIDVFNLIVHEYEDLAAKCKGKCERFPFSLPQNILVKLKKLFNEFLTAESLRKWFADENFPLIINEDFYKVYPTLLIEIISMEHLKQDFLLCRSLTIFSQLTDTSILETVEKMHLPCYYLTFCYLMKHCQDNEILDRNNYSRSNSTDWPLSIYLNTMLLMISLDQKEVFCEMGLKRNVSCNDVMYMMLHLEHTEKANSLDTYKNICLTYLQRLCECGVPLPLDNYYTLSLAVKLLALINDKFEKCCVSCWFLLPESQSMNIKFFYLAKKLLDLFFDVFISIIRNEDLFTPVALVSIRRSMNDTTEYNDYVNMCYKNTESCEHVICGKLTEQITEIRLSLLLALNIVCTLCHRFPELWKHLCQMQRNSPVKLLHIEHFIQLGNIGEIEVNFQPLTRDKVRHIFVSKSTLSDGLCLNCSTKIPVNREADSCWNDLALFALSRLGTKSSFQILNEFAVRVKLGKSFFRSVMLTSIPGVNSDLTNSVISAISSHYNVASVSTSVAKELDEALNRDKSDVKFSERHSDAHHWGMSLDMEGSNQAICYCCSLPLFSKYLIKENNGGIMVFSCSHTYHTICLKNKNCTATCLVCDRFLR